LDNGERDTGGHNEGGASNHTGGINQGQGSQSQGQEVQGNREHERRGLQNMTQKLRINSKIKLHVHRALGRPRHCELESELKDFLVNTGDLNLILRRGTDTQRYRNIQISSLKLSVTHGAAIEDSSLRFSSSKVLFAICADRPTVQTHWKCSAGL